MNASATQAQPVLDFRTLLKLGHDDTLDGYNLVLGGFIHVNNLREVEKAYLDADVAGLVKGALVQFNYRSTDIGVVTGRNLSVMSNIRTPARCPVEIHSCRGHYEYSVTDAQPIAFPAKVVGLTRSAELVEGLLTSVDVQEDDKGCTYASVVIDDKQYSMRAFAQFELAPTLQ